MRKTLYLVLFCLSSGSVLAAPLHNLDFEEYNPTTGAVPGWTFENTRHSPPTLETLPLNLDVGLPFDLFPPYATMYSGDIAWVLAEPGEYALGLLPLITVSEMFPWHVRQTGEIPADAKSMSFELGFAQVVLKLNGTQIPLQFYYRPDSTWGGWNLADVSSFAGQSVTMEFTAPGRLEYLPAFSAPGAPRPYTLLDNIRFSSSPIPPIPEPGTLVLALVGAAVMLMGRRLLKRPT